MTQAEYAAALADLENDLERGDLNNKTFTVAPPRRVTGPTEMSELKTCWGASGLNTVAQKTVPSGFVMTTVLARPASPLNVTFARQLTVR